MVHKMDVEARIEGKYDKSLKVEKNNGFFEVIYTDENGFSVLSRTKNYNKALQRWKKFAIDIEKGKLLRPDKSVYK